MTKKIAIDVGPLADDHRGMGFFAREFIQRLARAEHTDFQFCVATKSRAGRGEFPFPVSKPDELDGSWTVWFPFNRPTFRTRRNYVVTIHDLAPFVYPQGEKKLQKIFLRGAQGAKKIVTDSRFTLEEAGKYLKIAGDRISVIYPGFDPSWPEPVAADIGGPYILAVGPSEPRKNFRRLLAAFATLKKENFPHKLVIPGDLPRWRKTAGPIVYETPNPLPGLARKLKIADRVLFPGVVSRGALCGLYRGAALVMVPSEYEGFGFPPLEAFSCGAPVACSSAASLHEVAGDGAFYFDPKNQDEMAAVMYLALTDRNAVAHKKRHAEKQATRFGWDECLASYLRVFREA